MKLSKVLEKIEDNVTVQFLNDSLVSAKDKKRTGDTEITFATQEVDTNAIFNGGGRTAIIVWVSRNEFNKAMKD